MLRTCTGERVLIRDGRDTSPATSVQTRPAASGTEFCLFDGPEGIARQQLIERLETLSKGTGRRFAAAARARINDAFLLVDGVADEEIDGVTYTVVNTRRPKLGHSTTGAKAPQTTHRSKRIKTG